MRLLKRGWWLALPTLIVLTAMVGGLPAQDKKTPEKKAQPKTVVVIPEGTKVEKNLAYVEKGHARQILDIAVPPSEKPVPLIVWIHGGGWLGGSKENPPTAAEFLKQGYAVASINYRFSNQAIYPAQIHDCKAAIRWLRANAMKYNIDPDRIGVWGASAGGHLVALLGTTGEVKEVEGELGNPKMSSRVQAVIDVFGPADFLKYAEHMGKDDVFGVNSLLSKLIGGPVLDKKELAKLASPVAFVTKDDSPFLILQGDNDKLVPHQQSEEFHEALKKAGVTSELVIVPGAGHDSTVIAKNSVKVNDFFAKWLKK